MLLVQNYQNLPTNMNDRYNAAMLIEPWYSYEREENIESIKEEMLPALKMDTIFQY